MRLISRYILLMGKFNRIRNIFYYRDIVVYHRKSNIFDNIENIITILDASAAAMICQEKKSFFFYR